MVNQSSKSCWCCVFCSIAVLHKGTPEAAKPLESKGGLCGPWFLSLFQLQVAQDTEAHVLTSGLAVFPVRPFLINDPLKRYQVDRITTYTVCVVTAD